MSIQILWEISSDDFDMQTIGNFLSFASRGDRVGLNQMLREGISPNVQDYDKRTALHLAASEGHASIVELLLAYKADVNLQDRWQRTLDNLHNFNVTFARDNGKKDPTILLSRSKEFLELKYTAIVSMAPSNASYPEGGVHLWHKLLTEDTEVLKWALTNLKLVDPVEDARRCKVPQQLVGFLVNEQKVIRDNNSQDATSSLLIHCGGSR
ncbi:unnamed protein product [Ilex paraguariensis]|uniref:Uncharacterized protein n=1 Tax=Ilex paraguariensis TaxID=185542 RepID=A0ABC8S910_9AQUA